MHSPLKKREKAQNASKKLHVYSGKVYESDKDSRRSWSQDDNVYFDASSDSQSDDDTKTKNGVTTSCCSCFGVFGGKSK